MFMVGSASAPTGAGSSLAEKPLPFCELVVAEDRGFSSWAGYPMVLEAPGIACAPALAY